MKNSSIPKSYEQWRTETYNREEDAAHAFGYHLILHCRDEALSEIPLDTDEDTRKIIEDRVDTALHNVVDMLEGFWKLDSGSNYTIERALQVRVKNSDDELMESVEISPCKVDLPIGYWGWAQDRKFR